MKFKEELVNGIIANQLEKMNPKWTVTPEIASFIDSNKRVDMLVTCFGRQPVVIECEWSPAYSVEGEASSRLGAKLDPAKVNHSGEINSAVAVRLPQHLEGFVNVQDLEIAIKRNSDVTFEYALFTGASANNFVRFPSSGFISGTIVDLATFIDNAGISGDALFESIQVLESGVVNVANILRYAISELEDWKQHLAEILKQNFEDNGDGKQLDQLLAIATAIMINAMMYQQKLAGNNDIRSIEQLNVESRCDQAGFLKEWEKILNLNYWPIFHLAYELLAHITPRRYAFGALESMANTAIRLVQLGVSDSSDLAGAVFQRFIGDRKYLASFYTRPESATLLAHLSISDDGWENAKKMTEFKVADYACGTGTLIHAAYHRINQLVQLTGQDTSQYHAHMMDKALTACDIVPSAAHLTASMLSSVHPGEAYDGTRVLISEYGELEDGRVAIGSVELLDRATLAPIFPLGAPTRITGRKEDYSNYMVETPDNSQNLVIMNPPYTRAMSDWKEGGEGTWKQYRGLATGIEAQKRMRDREKELCKNSCYNGHAGLSTAFVAVADQKLKPEGIIALVLPLTSMHGVSWQKVRKMLRDKYTKSFFVAIAHDDPSGQAWSADTNMAECLVVAQKSNFLNDKHRGLFATLYKRPISQMEAVEFARAILSSSSNGRIRRLEDGPIGGSPIKLGDEIIGEIIDSPLTDDPWSWIPIKDQAISQAIYSLNHGRLFLPRMKESGAIGIEINQISTFAQVGWAANNIGNNKSAAFDRRPITDAATYPMLWACRSEVQRNLVVEADQEGAIRRGKTHNANKIWGMRSRAHLAAEIGYTSQSIGAAFTKNETIGGRSWPNIKLPTIEHEMAFCLWGNTTLGLMQYWYHASRQQGKRGILPVSSIATMPFFNVLSLSTKQLSHVKRLFKEFEEKEFLPVSDSHQDETRINLDHCVLFDLLKMNQKLLENPLSILRQKWCLEPSVGRKTS